MKFGKLTKLIENVQKLDQKKIFVSIISDRGIQQYIVNLNTVSQMFIDGVNSDGESLGSYAESTFLTYGKGSYYTTTQVYLDDEGVVRTSSVSNDVSAGDDIMLFENGFDESKKGLYSSYEVKVDDGGFTLSANTIKQGKKTVDLNLKYGDIVGLNEKSKSELAQAIIPIVIRYVKNSLVDEIPRDLFV